MSYRYAERVKAVLVRYQGGIAPTVAASTAPDQCGLFPFVRQDILFGAGDGESCDCESPNGRRSRRARGKVESSRLEKSPVTNQAAKQNILANSERQSALANGLNGLNSQTPALLNPDAADPKLIELLGKPSRTWVRQPEREAINPSYALGCGDRTPSPQWSR